MSRKSKKNSEQRLAEAAALEALKNRGVDLSDIRLVVVRLNAGRPDVSFVCASGASTHGGYLFFVSELEDKLDDGSGGFI